jgi:hypothetical protein
MASAAEDYGIPDFYTDINPDVEFGGIIPDDGILFTKQCAPANGSAAYKYFWGKDEEIRKEIIDSQPFQIADTLGNVFKFETPSSGNQVIFEDKKYLIVVDIKDNVEYSATGESVKKLSFFENIKSVRWKMVDPGSGVNMSTLETVKFNQDSGKAKNGWYLGPREPDVYDIASKQEVPMFEYVFHSPSDENAKPTLQIEVTDGRNLSRNIYMVFNVLDVKTEFKNYDGSTTRKRVKRLNNRLGK